MQVSVATANTPARERCPYCHDSLGEVERVACEGCGTPHHPVCLEELGGCTVLGCAGGAAQAPAGPVEEIRRRVRARAARFVAGRSLGADPEGAVRRRLAGQPVFCAACERELLVFSCPCCKGPIQEECAGDSVHCARASCRPFYVKLAKVVGQPIDLPQRRGLVLKSLAVGLALALGLVWLASVTLAAVVTGPAAAEAVLVPFVLFGAAAFVFGPLLVMMLMTKRR